MKMYDNICLASLAVLKNMSRSGLDAYSIIGEFVQQIYAEHSQGGPMPMEKVMTYLNEQYGLSLPLAVLTTSIKKHKNLEIKSDFIQSIDNSPIQDNGLKTRISQQSDAAEILFNKLVDFVEKSERTKISSKERTIIANDFWNYLLDDKIPTAYSNSIYKFLISGDYDKETINNIEEGCILYHGLTNQTLSDINNVLTAPLVIYLETEILFDAYGYNGLIHRKLYEDLICQVKQINEAAKQRKSKNCIYLRYLEKTKEETDAYFIKAEQIVSGRDSLLPGETAMKIIVSKCEFLDDVVEEKTRFYNFLTQQAILLDEKSAFYSQELFQNPHLAIDRAEITKNLQQYSSEYERINNDLDLLEIIKVRRGNRSQSRFSNIGHILLSSSTTIRSLSYNPLLKRNNDIPLATQLTFLTNKFWLASGGINNGVQLTSLDVVSRVQVVLASQFNTSTKLIFQDLQKKVIDGSLTREQIIECTSSLRMRTIVPEEIDDSNVDKIFMNIPDENINEYIQRQKRHEDELQTELLYYKERPLRIILYVGCFLIWFITNALILFLLINGVLTLITQIKEGCSGEISIEKILKNVNIWNGLAMVCAPLIYWPKKMRFVLSPRFFMRRNVEAYLEKIRNWRSKRK